MILFLFDLFHSFYSIRIFYVSGCEHWPWWWRRGCGGGGVIDGDEDDGVGEGEFDDDGDDDGDDVIINISSI